MRKIIAFFTSNWGLKILAVVLAIAVYYSLKETTRGGFGKNTPSTFLKGPADGGK